MKAHQKDLNQVSRVQKILILNCNLIIQNLIDELHLIPNDSECLENLQFVTTRIINNQTPTFINEQNLNSPLFKDSITEIEIKRGNCKCGSSTHQRISHKDCNYSKRTPSIDIEYIESPSKRLKTSQSVDLVY